MSVEKIIKDITEKLEGANGVVGIVLGGSRARGNNRSSSDIDIGIYYDESKGFNVQEISKIAAIIDDEHREDLVTPLGGWGPWVNAGGWLIVGGYHVDLILRNIKRVKEVIDDCLEGIISTNYHAGHPHAYLNVMYMGEISICRILSDPTDQIAELKEKAIPYPKKLQDAIIEYFMFEAKFSLMFANNNADKDDISYVSGCCFRAISCLNQALFAGNEEYCINEKKAVAIINNFNIKPRDYKKRIDSIVTLISVDRDKTKEAVNMLSSLVSETENLISNK